MPANKPLEESEIMAIIDAVQASERELSAALRAAEGEVLQCTQRLATIRRFMSKLSAIVDARPERS